jgi:hypothetical protein
MSDLEDLDDIRLDVEETPDQTETIALEEDTLMMPSASVPAVERPSESDAPDITFTLSEPGQEVPPLSVDPLETVSDLQLEGTLISTMMRKMTGPNNPSQKKDVS